MVSADLWLSSLDLVWLLSFDVLYEIIKAYISKYIELPEGKNLPFGAYSPTGESVYKRKYIFVAFFWS